MKRPGRSLRDERGVVLVWVAAAMVALCAITALAVDFGVLVAARTEAQRAADGAALAGASVFIGPAVGTSDAELTAGAIQRAHEFAALNPVRKVAPDVLPEDVDVLLNESKVRVRVRFEASRGTAIPTYFARVLGIDAVDIATSAAAEAAEAGSPYCDLPLALIDRWVEVDGDPSKYDDPPDYYEEEGAPHYANGEKVQLKLQPSTEGGGGPAECNEGQLFDPCNAFSDESWSCWYLPYPEPDDYDRNEDLRQRILGECPASETLYDGDIAYSTPGNAQALLEELAQYIDRYPNEEWDPVKECVVDTTNPEVCLEDPGRVRSVPLVRPDGVTGSGTGREGEIEEWTGVFMEKVACSDNLDHRGGPKGQWNLYVRFLRTIGKNPVGPGTGEPTLKALRLVE